ncbi:hypothetical protein ACTG9Q_12155 [Actinokineospora sp. 24-640]
MTAEPTSTTSAHPHLSQRRGGTGNISGDGNATVTDPQGPVHFGDQIYLSPDMTDRFADQVPRRRPVSEDRLNQLARRFEPPTGPDYEYARARLTQPGAVAISGEVGSGRHTAGLMLLHHSGSGASSFQELALADDGTLEPEARTVQEGERLLLDLSGARPAEFEAAEKVVGTFRAEVERRAYLVVVLPTAHGRFWKAEFGRVLELGFPNRRSALRRHLEADGIELPNEAWSMPELADYLRTGHMGDLAELAQQVRAARDWEDRRGDPWKWLAAAIKALAGQNKSARQHVEKAGDGAGKALLFTVAMLHGALVDEVFESEQHLLAEVRYPKSDVHSLDGKDFAQRLAAADVMVGDDRCVGFTELGLDAALRTYFWRAMPGLRPAFREWVKRVVNSRALTGLHKRNVVERFAEQALAVGGVNDLIELVQQWTRENLPVNSYHNTLADTLLQLGLAHEQCGPLFRRQFYEWATSSSTAAPLAHLVISLAKDILAPTHADQALVRLHHLTRHNDASVRSAAMDALLRLSANPRFWRRVLYRLCTNRNSEQPPEADRAIFSGLAAPDLMLRTWTLVGSAQIREQLTSMWNPLLTDPLDSTPELVGQWLDTGDPRLRAILVNAGARDPRLLGALYGIGRRWAAAAWTPSERDARKLVIGELRAAMDRSLELHFLETEARPEATQR